MSSQEPIDDSSSPPLQQSTSAPAPRLRLWPAVAALALFWAFLWGTQLLDLSMFARFMGRLAAYAALLLFAITWWFSRRTVPWRDRFGALAVVAAVGAGTSLLADRSMSPFKLFMAAFPVVATVGVAWLLASRSLTPAWRRVGFCATIGIACGYFALVRFDGLDAWQRSETSWRWEPTKEQVFLAAYQGAREAAPGQDADIPPWTPQQGDWLEFRGPRRDGVVTGARVPNDWTANPPHEVWRHKAGPSWSGLTVVDGRVVTQEQRGDAEVVVCLDAATGKEVWVHEDPVRFEESLSGAGPRGTPTYADSHVFALGGKGTLNCINAATGERVWSHDIVADAGVASADMPQWGYSNSPLVVDGLVIVFAGGGDKSVLAYRANNGELAWSSAGGKQSYSSPQLATFHGVKQVLMHDNKALQAIDPASGNVLWSYPNTGSEMSLPMLQPHQLGETNSLVISTEPGLARLDVKKNGDVWSTELAWETNRFRPGFNDFVIHRDQLYGLDDGIVCVFDLATGERLWKKGRLGHGQLLALADQDVLLASSNRGDIVLIAANPEAYEELGRFEAIEGKTWNGPVLVDGRVYLRNGEEIAAYELGKPATDLQAASAQSD